MPFGDLSPIEEDTVVPEPAPSVLDVYPEWVQDNALSYMIACDVRKFWFVKIEKRVYVPNDGLRTRAFIDFSIKLGAFRVTWHRPLKSIDELK
jgi:hypothetical protein